MKKITLSVLFILLAFVANAQSCFSSYRQPGTTVVQLMPDTSLFSNNYYHCHWNFNDGTPIDTVSYSLFHTYNPAMNGAMVCCEIRDNITDSLVCYSCDSIFFTPTPNCTFNLNQQSGSVVLATSQPTAGTYVEWSWGDGTFDMASTAIHTFPVSGPYTICMTVRDSVFHNILCNPCSLVVIQATSLCNFNYSQTTPSSFDFTGNIIAGSQVWWNFGDGTTDSMYTQVSHTYNSPGSYYVCISTLDSNGVPCQYCDYITAGGTSQSCIFSTATNQFNPNVFTFYPQISGSFANISWDFGDGSTHVDSISSPVSHTYSSTGVYTVCMKLSDVLGNITCTSCNIVQVNSTTNCNFFYTVNSSNNLQIGFAVNVSAPVHTVSWTFGDNTSDVGDSVVHNFNFPGTYQVCVTIVENGSVTCSSCQWITVGGNSGSCSILYWDTIPPNTERFYLQTIWSPNFPISWDFGDGSTGSGQLIDHTYAIPGTYTVCALQLDTAGAQVCSTCVNIIIGPGPVNCHASFLSTSFGYTGYFIDLSVAPLNNTTYSWDFGDGGTSNIRFPQHAYASPATYTVCQTITSGNCVDQFCSPIVIDTATNPVLGCQSFFAIVQLATFQVSVVNLSSGANLSYSWDFGDGSTDTVAFPSHYYSTTGQFNLCLSVSDGNGCTSSYCDTIEVDSLGYIYRGMSGFSLNVYSPMQVTTGVKTIDPLKSFKAFPNPVSSDLYVTSTVEKFSAYRILSIQGAEISSGNLTGTENRISMQKFSTGSYLLEITFNDGSKNYQTIIKN